MDTKDVPSVIVLHSHFFMTFDENYKTPLLNLNNLFKGFDKTLKSKPHKRSNLQYREDVLFHLIDLKDSLANKTYKKSHNKPFKIHERGKERVITSSPVKDRIIGHVWWDDIICPQILPKLTKYNSASIKGRGTDYFRKSLKKAMLDYYAKYHTNDGYIVIWDMSKYFDNLDHKVLYKKMKRFIHCDLELYILKEILDSFKQDVSWMSSEEYQNAQNQKFDSLENFNKSHTGEKYLNKGCYIGDLESQGFGIIYLDEVDHFLEQNSNVFWNGRYMDDFGAIVTSIEQAKELIAQVEDIVTNKLKAFLNSKKVRIYKLSKSFKILNRHYYLTSSGYVVETLDKKTIKQEKHRLKSVNKDYVINSLKSWWGANKDVMTKTQKINFINYIKRLDVFFIYCLVYYLFP